MKTTLICRTSKKVCNYENGEQVAIVDPDFAFSALQEYEARDTKHVYWVETVRKIK